MITTMPDKPKPKGKRYPSREKTKYAAVPLELWNELKDLAKREDRSVSWYVRRIVREFLSRRKASDSE